jgi:ankyrin repeat protein
MVRYVLTAGTKPKLQPQALGLAAWEGQLAIVQLLLEHGFDVNSTAYQGRTPLRHARNRKHHAVADLLLAAGGVG